MEPLITEQKGYVLILVLSFLSVIILTGTLVMSLTNREVKDMGINTQEIKALNLADAGLEKAIYQLKNTSDWSLLLKGPDEESETADDGTFSGSSANLGEGTYSAVITDNDDADSDLFDDQDNSVIVRSTGTVGNVQKEIESEVTIPHISVPSCVYLANYSDATFAGDKFLISGDDYAIGADVSSPTTTGAKYGIATTGFIEDIGLEDPQKSFVKGTDYNDTTTPATPSLTNIISDPINISDLIEQYYSVRDEEVSGGTYARDFGSSSNYQVTYCSGNMKLSGNKAGYGVLVVNGSLEIIGKYSWYGLIIVAKQANIFGGDYDVNIYGAVVIENNPSSSPALQFSKKGIVLYSSEAITNVNNMHKVSSTWREVN